MKTIYITGCLGFIGSHLTRRCLDLGWNVYGIDKCTYAANINYLDEFLKYNNFYFNKLDIKDIKELKDCDFVINTAAESHVDNSINNSNDFIESNIIGVKNLLELIRNKEEKERPVFFHFSTDEVYGDILTGSHSEDDILKPSNPYSATKAAADMLILAWSRTYNIDYVILRPTNNYGIGQYPEKLIPLSIKKLSKNEKIQLHNNGKPIRTWIHVEDTVNAVLKIIENDKKNEIFNVSGGFECENYDTVRMIINYFFNKEIIDINKFLDLSYNRKGQDVRYSLNDAKLKSIGWQPEKFFAEELKKIVNFEK
jgi:dTDP-glucose 4,6-dehydratase